MAVDKDDGAAAPDGKKRKAESDGESAAASCLASFGAVADEVVLRSDAASKKRK